MVIQATQESVVIAVGQELAAIVGSQVSLDIQALVGSAVTLDSQESAVIQGSPVNLVTLVSPESRATQVILVFQDIRVTVESPAIPATQVFLAILVSAEFPVTLVIVVYRDIAAIQE